MKWKATIWDWPRDGARYCAMRGDEVFCDERGPVIVGSRMEAMGLVIQAERLNPSKSQIPRLGGRNARP